MFFRRIGSAGSNQSLTAAFEEATACHPKPQHPRSPSKTSTPRKAGFTSPALKPVLYNDAVTMTGGQAHDGPLTPWGISWRAHSEGVKAIALVSDAPDKYAADVQWAPGVTLHHRRELDWVQTKFRKIPGTTLIIYDQTCAAEKRRRRKRNLYPDPAKRLFINSELCEGCGDCEVASNCTALLPKETLLGRKREIDQSACNKDYSCVNGFCPSFVTVLGGGLRKPEPATGTG